jgi:hypothetical protein
MVEPGGFSSAEHTSMVKQLNLATLDVAAKTLKFYTDAEPVWQLSG